MIYHPILYFTLQTRRRKLGCQYRTDRALNNSTARVRIPHLWDGSRLTKKGKKKKRLFFVSITYRTDFQKNIEFNSANQTTCLDELTARFPFLFFFLFEVLKANFYFYLNNDSFTFLFRVFFLILLK